MVSTVVVPLDGSSSSEAALDTARRLSAGFGARLLLFAAAGEDRPEVEAYLRHVASAAPDRPVSVEVCEGFASCGLAETVRRIDGAAVCAAPDVWSPGDVLGPAVEDVIDTGNAPVVLVGSAGAGIPQTERRRGLVLCTDGSVAASSIEGLTATWAGSLGLDIHIVTVLDLAGAELAGVPVERIRWQLSNLEFRLRQRVPAVRVEIIDTTDDPAFAITRYAMQHPIAIIATSSRGHRHALHSVVGDTILHLVRCAPVPVLVCKPVPAGVGMRTAAASGTR